jgi:hypothetical protein
MFTCSKLTEDYVDSTGNKPLFAPPWAFSNGLKHRLAVTGLTGKRGQYRLMVPDTGRYILEVTHTGFGKATDGSPSPAKKLPFCPFSSHLRLR